MFGKSRLLHSCETNNNGDSTMEKKSNSQSAFFNLRSILITLCLTGISLTLFGSGGLLSGQSATSQTGSANQGSPRHKLSVRDPQLVTSLKNRGALVVGDYGSFVLLETDDALTRSVAGNPQAEIVDHNNLI